MVTSDDSVAPYDARGGALAPAAEAAGSGRVSRSAGIICTAVALSWTAFFLYTETGLATRIDGYAGRLLTDGLGWSLSLLPSEAGIRSAHLLFAVALAILASPSLRAGRRAAVTVSDWILVLVATAAAAYIVVFREDITARTGYLQQAGTIAAVAGSVVLCVAAYRAIGAHLLAVVGGFNLAAMIAGNAAFGARSGAAFEPLRHFWLGTEGVFGRPLEIAVTLIFPLVLFGTLWLQAGAGAYFTRLAASCFGAKQGGAGKTTIAASVVSGCYAPSASAHSEHALPASGPLMEYAGMAPQTARTIQRASSSHAQLVPPVMAVAAVLIAEQTGLSIGRVALHAMLPLAIAYIALYLFVHADAERTGVAGLPARPYMPNRVRNVVHLIGWCIFTVILAGVAALVLAWLGRIWPQATLPVSVAAWLLIYVALLWSASRRPDLPSAVPPGAPVAELAPFGATLASGLYLVLPLFFLVLGVAGAERPAGMSMLLCAGLAAGIVITHHPAKALFRGHYDYVGVALGKSARDLFAALMLTARVMTPVMIAAAAAGLMLASSALIGLDQWLVTGVRRFAAGHQVLGLVPAVAAAMVLATGMPTAVGYAVLAVLVVPAVAAAGFAVPPVGLHLFVLYLCVVASDPPPSLATVPLVLVPVLFLVNPELALIGVEPARVPIVAATAVLGAVAMAAALHRHLLAPNRVWETVSLVAAATGLLCPGVLLDGPRRDLVYLPALVLLGAVWLMQLRRRKSPS